ncbi:MAG: hypothetical protein QOI42_882, partial [Frankiaceae bacterium]|nr:hypothetical protein [Frankiaceae bacterium]
MRELTGVPGGRGIAAGPVVRMGEVDHSPPPDLPAVDASADSARALAALDVVSVDLT